MNPNLQKVAFGGIVAVILAAAGLTALLNDGYMHIKWDKPTTDAEWAEDVKEESFHVKRTDQLEKMLEDHTKKLELMTQARNKFTECEECVKYTLKQEVTAPFKAEEERQKIKVEEGKELDVTIDGDAEIVSEDTKEEAIVMPSDSEINTIVDEKFAEQEQSAIWQVEKLAQSIERIENELRLRKEGYFDVLTKTPGDVRFDPRSPEFAELNAPGSRVRTPLGTAYYIDFTAAAGGNGLATTTAFDSLDDFTEAARSAGDIAFVRRGVASTTNVSTLDFTSDGTSVNPIQISADYDNLWNEFATSTETYSVAVGTTTLYASASITDVSAGEWIYVEGDCTETYNSTTLNSCEFSYEVAGVSGNELTLYLPYHGNQSGSGLDLRIMPSAPQWNTTGTDFDINFNGDNFWIMKGLDMRGAGNLITISSSNSHVFNDMIFRSNNVFFNPTGSQVISAVFERIRFAGSSGTVITPGSGAGGYVVMKDVLVQCSGGCALLANNLQSTAIRTYFENFYFFTTTPTDIFDCFLSTSNYSCDIVARNWQYTLTSGGFADYNTIGEVQWIYMEDFDGTVGWNKWWSGLSDQSSFQGSIVSTTSASHLRSGGGPKSIEVYPDDGLSSGVPGWVPSQYKLFEYPIYSDGTSHQYDVYFMSPSDTWTTNPTASQLWIECDYWAHDTNATSTRATKKSTGTVDFNGSTAWQSLSVTCDPKQEGTLYLRGWYAKTKEAGTNLFFIDATPVIN